MSYDLFLKNTRTNWARGHSTPVEILPPAAPAPSAKKFVCTPEEKSKLVQIAALKKAALSGDRKSRKQWKKLCKGLPKLQKAAAKGDPKAQRDLQCLRASKLFASPIAMRGDFVGRMYTATELLHARSNERKRNAMRGESCQELEIRAAAGDVQAQQSLARQKATGQCGDFVGAYATQILGDSLNDDEASVAQEGGSSERESFSRMRGLGGIVIEDKEIKSAIDGWISGQNWNQPGYRGRRGNRGRRIHRLKVLVRSAARNDAGAIAKLDRFKQKLNARAAAGDTRATTMLQNIQRWYDIYRGQVTTAALPAGAPPVLPPTYPSYTAPVPAPTYPAQTYYPSAPSGYVPGADNEDYDE